ncbi:hypothetical protein [Salirhabdus salicampi]|uniref:hypothetical protein n=1 Tax=Salirhabdus salicampi TaxID=476102 RepID=UPI0020C22FFF|nr:hypothetical protein [Salirhabdus salicampi]MCP8617118.1 hypothetical protein [Salirhabdus salicampi]
MDQHFTYHPRLKIYVPKLDKKWSMYSRNEQEIILQQWETIRGQIPDRIRELEYMINQKQAALREEENFEASCALNDDICDLASIINELWIWFRKQVTVSQYVNH